MPKTPKTPPAFNMMGGQYNTSFSGSVNPYFWLSSEHTGAGTIWYYSHPLGVGTPSVVIIPTGFGAGGNFAGSATVGTPGSVGALVTAGGTYRILALM